MSTVAVIGAGTAGLLASTVLSKYYDEVYLVERDNILDFECERTGIPQRSHIHTLLLGGLRILEAYYPEIQADMDKMYCPSIRWGEDVHVQTLGGVSHRYDLGIETRGISRSSLDKLLGIYTLRIPNIVPIVDATVTGLTWDDNTAQGIEFTQGTSIGPQNLDADLIVVASGRNTAIHQWLKQANYKVPEPTCVNAYMGYASRRYKIPAQINLNAKGIAIQPRPHEKFYRGAGATQVEHDEVIITLVGVNSDYPPTDAHGYVEFARSLSDPKTAEWIEQLEPISPISGFRPISTLQHYNKIPDYPDNLLIIGDAFCSLNPFYGQGMTMAAMTASLLDKMLSDTQSDTANGFSQRFQNRLARIIQFPWLVGVAEDLRYPQTEGVDEQLIYKLAQWGTDFLLEAVGQDANVAKRFVRVMHMVDHPLTLLDPIYGLHCLRYAISHMFKSSSHS